MITTREAIRERYIALHGRRWLAVLVLDLAVALVEREIFEPPPSIYGRHPCAYVGQRGHQHGRGPVECQRCRRVAAVIARDLTEPTRKTA